MFDAVLNFFKTQSFTKTNWSRWFGALLVLVIVFVWARTSLIKGEFLPFDSTTAGILVFVFLVNGLKLNKKE